MQIAPAGTMGSNSFKTKTRVAQGLLVFANLVFLVAGILMIVYSVKLNDSGWLDVFNDQFPWMKSTLFACMIALGCVVMIIAFIGCAGASFEKKWLLRCYNSFIALAFTLFFIVMAGAFASLRGANDWKGKEYPAANEEPKVAQSFNEVYCYSEAAYLCTSAPLAKTINALIPGLPAEIVSLADDYKGLNSLCEDTRLKPFLGAQKSLKDACDACSESKKYEQYNTVFEWVDDQCPLVNAGSAVIGWCGDFLYEGKTGKDYDGAPYGACRPQFLDLWSDTSKKLGIALVFFLVFLLAVIVSTCFITRRNIVQERNVGNEGETKESSLPEKVTQDEEPSGKNGNTPDEDMV